MPRTSRQTNTAAKTKEDLLKEIEDQRNLVPKPEGHALDGRILKAALAILAGFTRVPAEQRTIEARHFGFLHDPASFHNRKNFSYDTVRRVRKILGIRIIRNGRKTLWTRPAHSWEDIMEEHGRRVHTHEQLRNPHLKKIRTLEQMLRVRQGPSGCTVMEIMITHNYDGPREQVMQEFMSHGFSSHSLSSACTAWGIETILDRFSKEWRLIWCGPPVIDWLAAQIAQGSPDGLADSVLVEEASLNQGWSSVLIHSTLARNFAYSYKQGSRYWFFRMTDAQSSSPSQSSASSSYSG